MLGSQWVGFLTLVTKEVRRFFRIWMQTVLPSVLTGALYFVVFGGFLGSRIQDFQGFSYIEFIVPGLILLPMISGPYINTSSSFYMNKFAKSIEEMLVSPLSSTSIMLGFVSAGMLRGFVIGAGLFFVAKFFTGVSSIHRGLTLFTAFFTTALFSMLGFLNGMLATKWDDINIVPNFILVPFIYLGGVFHSLTFLPPFWQTVSRFNPILYIINSFRYALLGYSEVNVTVSVAVLISLNLVVFMVCRELLKRGVGLRN